MHDAHLVFLKIYFLLLIMEGYKGGDCAFVCMCPQGQSHQTLGAGLTETYIYQSY